MPNNSFIYLGLAAALVAVCWFGWKMSSRSAYESAEYSVLSADGSFEIREYPDLWLAATQSSIDAQGGDGGFMRLFRYISGNNDQDQKIAMTTPVFMEQEASGSGEQMGFVLPKTVAAGEIPEPSQASVELRKRDGGKFAVLRFAGRTDGQAMSEAETKLRKWMQEQGLSGQNTAEMAGYDPPWIPGMFRRNEVLIRLN
ncbi:MAG: heme-binding protein [Planctomycetaceae bacterium]|nr:heme-binding protein [Planctomycetaceae bacterium]MCP4462525.1 heme-binding protein [Planctomycetaceae bacterium]MDG1809722.1 heme-binding protein [Pirellulaceae bacterium]MDG2102344.1 heme-binding protein [Pirellulaceae bacterium]